MPALNVVGTVFRKVFGSRNERLLKVYNRNVVLINSFESGLRGDFDARFTAALAQFEAANPIPKAEDGKTSPWTAAPTEAAESRDSQIQKIRVELSADLRDRTAKLRERLAKGEP